MKGPIASLPGTLIPGDKLDCLPGLPPGGRLDCLPGPEFSLPVWTVTEAPSELLLLLELTCCWGLLLVLDVAMELFSARRKKRLRLTLLLWRSKEKRRLLLCSRSGCGDGGGR